MRFICRRAGLADRARRAEAGIPEEVAFATKPKLGLAMLERAHAAGLPFAWVTADSVYGADHSAAPLAAGAQARLRAGGDQSTAAGLRPRRGPGRPSCRPRGWHRLSAGDGAKGPRLYDWAYLPYGSDAAPGWEKGLLIRRSIAAARRARLLPDPRRRRHRTRRPRPGRRHALGDRGLLRGGQGRGRPR